MSETKPSAGALLAAKRIDECFIGGYSKHAPDDPEQAIREMAHVIDRENRASKEETDAAWIEGRIHAKIRALGPDPAGLAEALEFYANKDTWTEQSRAVDKVAFGVTSVQQEYVDAPIKSDKGDKARAALAEWRSHA